MCQKKAKKKIYEMCSSMQNYTPNQTPNDIYSTQKNIVNNIKYNMLCCIYSNTKTNETFEYFCTRTCDTVN